MVITRKKKKSLFLWISAYAVSTVFIYLAAISPLFSYSYLTANINYIKLFGCFALYILTIYFLPMRTDKASSYLFYLIYLITYIPTLMYTWMNNMEMRYILYFTVCIILIEVMLSGNNKDISFRISCGKNILLLLFVVYIVSSLILVIRNGGINKSTFMIYQVSSTRTTNNISGLWGYLLNWCAKSFSPMFFAYFAYKKKWVWVAVVCIIQAIFYLSFGFKAFLFSIILLILIFCVLRKGTDYFKLMPELFVFIHIVSYVFYKFNITKLPLFTFAYRTIFIPAQCQFQYFEYFTEHRFLYFSEGIIGKLLGTKYPYSLPIGVIVNQFVYGSDFYSNGNTGMFSYGFADCGFIGMVLASLVLIFIFLVIDGSIKNMPIQVVVAAMSYQMFILNDTNILISLNTGGILWTIIMLIIIDPILMEKGNKSENRRIRPLIRQ